MKKQIILKREELYNKVWSTPMIKLAKEFNLSDNGLRKICKVMDIPVPPVGFWTKLRHGNKVKTEPLPEPKPNSRTEYILSIPAEKPILPKPKEIVLPELKLTKDFRNLHPILRETLESEKRRDFTKWGKTLRLKCSKDTKNRVVIILDTIFKELESRGYILSIQSGSGRSIPCAIDKEIKIPFFVREFTVKQIIDNPKDSWGNKVEYIFSGKLVLIFEIWGVQVQTKFSDNNKKKVEEYLPEFIHNISQAFEQKKEYLIKERLRQKEQEKLRVLREIEKRKEEEEIKRINVLIETAAGLKSYREISYLLLEIRKKYDKELETNEKLKNWIIWAEEIKKKLNPLRDLNFLS